MLDQLDHMQVIAPTHTHSFVAVSSYAIGPLDPVQVTSLHVHLSTGGECSLLIPTHVPSSLLAHPVFQDGSEWGYLEGNSQDERWTFPRLLNELYANLEELSHTHIPDVYPWTLGVLLGELASIAEQDQTLALTGLAHCCFLLPLFTRRRPADWPHREPYLAHYLHRDAMKIYRARIRRYREQGKSFEEAQRLALKF